MSAAALAPRPNGTATVIGITSGRGGVGKTAVAVNLAISLARRGHRVGLVDAALGLGKVDEMLGLTVGAHLGDVLRGDRKIDETVLIGPAGIRVVPGWGERELTSLDPEQRLRFGEALATFQRDLDFVLIDTAVGISGHVVDLLTACARVLVVTSPDATTLVDGYALMKLLATDAPHIDLGLLVNQPRSADDGSAAFRRLEPAVRRFLGRSLSYYGSIPCDPALAEAVRAQEAVVDRHPHAPASRSFGQVALRLSGLGPVPMPRVASAPPLSLVYSSPGEVRPCA